MKERSPVTVILLSIVTCGIYSLYWLAVTTNEIESELQNKDGTLNSGATAVILSIITCGIYELYWFYKQGQRTSQLLQQAHLPEKDNSVLYLILAVLSFSIVPIIMIQDDLNRYVKATNY